jgi:hypothetical protein
MAQVSKIVDITDLDGPENDNTNFDVEAVNIEENSYREPIRYVSPPGVVREQLYNNNSVINQNEQSLVLRVAGDGLQAGDSRAVFKNISVDMRQFKKLKMFLHAESLPGEPDLADNDNGGFHPFRKRPYRKLLSGRNPVKGYGAWSRACLVGMACRKRDRPAFGLADKIKILSKTQALNPGEIFFQNENQLDPSRPAKLNIGVRGNPNFGLVRTLMVGVKNSKPVNPDPAINRIKGEAWFNELRLSEMDNEGGMAAVVNIDGNIADFATVSATGKISTIGFGTLEEGPNERSREDLKQYNIVTNLSLGKLLPKKWGINLPFNYAIGEETLTPEYDPFNQDIKLKQLLEVTPIRPKKTTSRIAQSTTPNAKASTLSA